MSCPLPCLTGHAPCLAFVKMREKNKSTKTALRTFTDHIYEALDNRKFVPEQFNTNRHNNLLHNFAYSGIRGISVKWFDNYKNRKQLVSVMFPESMECLRGLYWTPCFSYCRETSDGVTQGVTLGPLPFLV